MALKIAGAARVRDSIVIDFAQAMLEVYQQWRQLQMKSVEKRTVVRIIE